MNKISVAVQGLDCAICAKPAHGLHFGVRSCRPCAAFFRRCNLEKLVYRCRWQNACQMSMVEERMACKSCRFRLCHEAGMRYRARKEMLLDEQAPPIADGTKLAAVVRAHNLSLREMRKVFLKNCRCHNGNTEKEVPEMLVLPLTEACTLRMEHTYRPIMLAMLETAFEPFNMLDQEMKLSLLADCFHHFGTLNAVLFTLCKFPMPEDAHFLLDCGHGIDMEQLEEMMERWASNANANANEVQHKYQYLSNRRAAIERRFEFIQKFKKLFNTRNVHQLNICALMSITVCNKAAIKWPLARTAWNQLKEVLLTEWHEQLIGTNSHSSAAAASMQMAALISSLGQLEFLCLQMKRSEATSMIASGAEQLEADENDENENDGFNYEEEEEPMFYEGCSSASLGIIEIKKIAIFYSADLESASFLARLIQTDAKARRIRCSSTSLSIEYLRSCGDFRAILSSSDNLLAHAHEFSLIPKFGNWNRAQKLQEASQRGLLAKPYEALLTDLLTGIHLAKTLPAFQQIELDDKLVLIKGLTPIIYFFFNTFQSSMQMSETLMDSTGASPHAEWSAAAQHYYGDPLIGEAARKIFTAPMQQFLRVRPTAEEMALLFALLFSNSAISGLSAHGQRVLQEEEQKFGQLLLRMQQRHLGSEAGAQRYMEALHLLSTVISQGRRLHGMLVYLDTLHEKGKLLNVVPPNFRQ